MATSNNEIRFRPPERPRVPIYVTRVPQNPMIRPRQQVPEGHPMYPGMPEGIQKLVRLLRSFIHLCHKNAPERVSQCINYIERYIQGNTPTCDFINQVSQLVEQNPQNNLPVFLEKNLPLLQVEINRGNVTIAQVLRLKPHSENVPSPQNRIGNSPQSLHQSPQSSQHMPMQQRVQTTSFQSLPQSSQPHIIQAKGSHTSVTRLLNEPLAQMEGIPSQARIVNVAPFSNVQPNIRYSTPVTRARTVPAPMGARMQYVTSSPQVVTTVVHPVEAQPEVLEKSVMPSKRPDSSFVASRACGMRVARTLRGVPAAVDEKSVRMISEFVENRLRKILNRSNTAAEHRLAQLRSNSLYIQTSDPRKQLRAIEKNDRAKEQRRADIEKEAILKLSKSKGKDTDMLEKAKQIRKADEEATMNREANEAANAALGSKGVKRNWGTANKDSTSTSGNTPSFTPRNRLKRITIKDLQFAFERDNSLLRSKVYQKIIYGLIVSGT